MRKLLVLTAAVILATGPFAGLHQEARADGASLDGRKAPELVFPGGVNGLAQGTRLSSLQGSVVWLKFILRDCPTCHRQLPRAQKLHDQWGGSGLVVLVIMHGRTAKDTAAYLARSGFTFRTGLDPDGSLAKSYGVRRRPTDFVIGVDGRVSASNKATDDVLRTELGRYRLNRLGGMPEELAEVRTDLWNWDYASALKRASAASAKPGASDAVQSAARHVTTLARDELEARLAQVARLEAQQELDAAGRLLDRVWQHFQGTVLEAETSSARVEFRGRHPSVAPR